MKRKLQKKSKIPKQFELIDSADVKIKNSFIDFNKKSGHLQETAEIVEVCCTFKSTVTQTCTFSQC